MTRRLRIGFVKTSPLRAGRPHISGVTAYLVDLAGEIARRGHAVSFIALHEEVPRRAGWILPGLARALARRVARESLDLLYVNLAIPEMLTTLAAADRIGVPAIASFHTYEVACPLKTHVTVRGLPCDAVRGPVCRSEGCRSVWKRLAHDRLTEARIRRHARRARLFLAHNTEVARLAERAGFGVPRLVPLPVDTRVFRASPVPATREVLFAGRLRPEKGILPLAEAACRWLAGRSDARLTVAGEGPLAGALAGRLARAGLAPRVAFEGPVAREALAALYSRARVVVLPSLWKENVALVGLEAMASGRPVVGSDLGGIREWLSDGECGILVPPGDPERLAAAVGGLLDDDRLAIRMGAEAARRVEPHRLDRVGDTMESLFREHAGR